MPASSVAAGKSLEANTQPKRRPSGSRCASLGQSVCRLLEDEQPSRAEMLRTLAEVKNAAEVLMNALGRPVVLEILGTIRPVHIPKVLHLLAMLRDLHDQA